MSHRGHFWRRTKEVQRTFAFLERSGHRQRRFKLVIFLATTLAVLAIMTGSPRGRYTAVSIWSSSLQEARRVLGIPVPRSEIDRQWRRYRAQGVTDSRRALIEAYRGWDPAIQKLMRYGGLDPENGLLRWGNHYQTLLLPSTVFEADDTGRSYRLRARVESVWLRNVTPDPNMFMYFLVPDGPGLKEAMRGTTAIRVEESRQTTNSWGVRGREPDLEAPLRGLVLGDSFMQGLFVGNDNAPPECLRRYLETRLKIRTSILNTGVLGYSPEQYYYSFQAFADRFQPHFVVVSFFPNDFGYMYDALAGKGDWEEARYWLDAIARTCRARKWPCLFVAAPERSLVHSFRNAGNYPGKLTNILEVSGPTVFNPIEAFVDKHLDVLLEGALRGERPAGSLLFNDQNYDGHFSARGSEVWASAVGERLSLVLEREHVVAKHRANSGKTAEGEPAWSN